MKRTALYSFALMLVVQALLFPWDVLAQADFDFQEFAEDTRIEGEKRLSIPLSGRASVEGAYQVGEPKRWILSGLSLNLIFDSHHGKWGQIYFEGYGRFNLAYRIEDDTTRTRDDYELEGVLREFFWKNNFGRLTLAGGKIIDDRTVMDILQVVDKTSAINRSDFFFADPEEVKLGQNMIRLEYFFENDAYAGLNFVPYPAFDRVTDFDHPYSLVKDRYLVRKDDTRDVEGSLYAQKAFSKASFSWYVGRFNNRTPILKAQLSSPDDVLGLYAPYWSIGGSITAALEPLLLKFEAAYNFDRPLQSQFQGLPAGSVRHDESEFALGVDYNSGDYGMFTVEFFAAVPLANDDKLAMNRPVFWGALSWSDSYCNDKLNPMLVTYFLESIENMVNRFQVEYYFTDTFSIIAKYTRFQIASRTEDYGFLKGYDRVDISLNFDFSLD